MNADIEIKLPYPEDSFAPVLSREAVSLHVHGHHLGYLKKLAHLIKGTPFEHHPLEEIIAETRMSCEHCCVFNNAAQAWNHDFFWNSLGPIDKGGKPNGALLRKIERDYGSFQALKMHIASTAEKRFGSGWVWLAELNGRLGVFTTPNGETPAANPDFRPIVTIDLWEHAYYLDWHNHRSEYVNAVLDRLVDWNAASKRVKEE